jgi:hypothetical protein
MLKITSRRCALGLELDCVGKVRAISRRAPLYGRGVVLSKRGFLDQPLMLTHSCHRSLIDVSH